MRYIIKCALLLACILSLSTNSFANDPQTLAIEAAQSFTSIIDDGNYLAAYWAGSDLLRLAMSEQKWNEQSEQVRTMLGKYERRTLKSTRSVPSFPGYPDGDYTIVNFETKLTHKAKAAEVLLIENGSMRVCSYFIR